MEYVAGGNLAAVIRQRPLPCGRPPACSFPWAGHSLCPRPGRNPPRSQACQHSAGRQRRQRSRRAQHLCRWRARVQRRAPFHAQDHGFRPGQAHGLETGVTLTGAGLGTPSYIGARNKRRTATCPSGPPAMSIPSARCSTTCWSGGPLHAATVAETLERVRRDEPISIRNAARRAAQFGNHLHEMPARGYHSALRIGRAIGRRFGSILKGAAHSGAACQRRRAGHQRSGPASSGNRGLRGGPGARRRRRCWEWYRGRAITPRRSSMPKWRPRPKPQGADRTPPTGAHALRPRRFACPSRASFQQHHTGPGNCSIPARRNCGTGNGPFSNRSLPSGSGSSKAFRCRCDRWRSAEVGAWSPARAYWGVDSQGEVKIWDTKTGQLRWTLAGHPSSVMDVEFDPEEKRVVTTGAVWDGRSKVPGGVVVWDLATGKELWSLKNVSSQRPCSAPMENRCW